MPDIKTRDVAKGTIKQIDKAAVAADRMRSAYISTKDKAEHTTHAAEANPEEYASDKVQHGTERVTHEAVHQFDKQGRKGVEQTKENIQKSKEQIKRFKEKRAEKALDRQAAHRSGETISKTGDSVYRSSSPVWKEVIAVYAVKTNTDPDNAQEVATMDEDKKQLLTDIFWEMNDISSRSETKTVTVIEESDDGYGNIVQTEREETETILYITVAHKTADEMASQYGFNDEQKELLAELLSDENNSLWAAVLYGIGYSDDQIVTVALSQVGNVGGDPYWSWYGFNSRVEWCACFVSWCANECGYIESGIIPKYAGCVNGVQWFKDRGQWADGDAEPVPGMIIFFDWDDPDGSAGPQDGESDHTGIVQKVEDGVVYTVEGNSGDSCRVNHYPVGYYEILGYGIPQY